jgi:hypothetical protein
MLTSKNTIAFAAFATLVAACVAEPAPQGGSSSSGVAPTSASAVQSGTPSTAERQWRDTMASTPTPGEGCFEASPSDSTWKKVACGARPTTPLGPPSHLVPAHPGDAVPDGMYGPTDNFVFLPASSGRLTAVTGSFPMEVGGTGESDTQSGADDPGANSYSLQLNTNTFSTASCSSSFCQICASTSGCSGWEQFVYDAPRGQAFIQDWMVGYSAGCPSNWTRATVQPGSIPACYFSTSNANAPVLGANQLQGVQLVGSTSGGNDTLTLFVNGAQAATGTWASQFNLGAVWTAAEFNVFGNASGTQAVFGSSTEMEVELLLKPSTASTAAPTCGFATLTAESNSLTIGNCCPFGGSKPGMQFFQTNIGSATPPACPALLVSPDPLQIPANSGGQGTATVELTGGLWDPSVSLWPTTCSATGPLAWSFSPYFGVLNATFTLPSGATPGQSFSEEISCTNGFSANETVEVTSPTFYPYPSNTELQDGTCVDIPLVWNDGPVTDCNGVTYALTSPTSLPAGVSADIVGAGIEIGGGFAQVDLAVCASVPNTTMEGFNFTVTSNGCYGGPYEANGTINLVPPPPPPPCQPATCKANSCQGTVPDGCGGTLFCNATCSSGQVCESGQCVTPNPTCPTGKVWCASLEECTTALICSRGGGGSSSGGGCKPGTCM